MPFGLKNAPSEFQNIVNDIFNSFSHFTIVYIDDVLVYSSCVAKVLKLFQRQPNGTLICLSQKHQ